MQHRPATAADLPLLAEWNHRLIRDEGHRNPMTIEELRARMAGWLAGEYEAVIFSIEELPVGYALYRETDDEVHLRQFFIIPERRREGLGRRASEILRQQVWPPTKRLTVEVLTANRAALRFWRAAGYSDYCLTLEIRPE